MIAAVAYRTAMGLPVVYPKREFSYTKNFLYMMFKDPMSDTFDCDDFLVTALEKILILHADHE
jgi:citrate synthase